LRSRNQICLANRNRISPKLLELPGLLTVRALAVLARNRVFADEGTELNHATALYVLLALEERIGARSDEFLNSSGNGWNALRCYTEQELAAERSAVASRKQCCTKNS
jgi:hypothetical protein